MCSALARAIVNRAVDPLFFLSKEAASALAGPPINKRPSIELHNSVRALGALARNLTMHPECVKRAKSCALLFRYFHRVDFLSVKLPTQCSTSEYKQLFIILLLTVNVGSPDETETNEHVHEMNQLGIVVCTSLYLRKLKRNIRRSCYAPQSNCPRCRRRY